MKMSSSYLAAAFAVAGVTALHSGAHAQSVKDPNLEVRTVATGLSSPIWMTFLSANDILVGEKVSGKIRRVTNGVVGDTVLDLAVNSNSERGLLSFAMHPDFPNNPSVYVYWSESTTGVDSTDASSVPLLGNRLDQFTWDGTKLTFSRNIWQNRAYQADAGQPVRGNHNGGVIRFGPEKKLYLIVGDAGRRGYLQNNKTGPFPDDQFGGPLPDDAHTTGVIYRMNDDGSAPLDNPFFGTGAFSRVNWVYGYGVRNSFGLTFDPYSGRMWTEENGDDSFDEINQPNPGYNGGWIQMMGPASRVAEFRAIETAPPDNLQQLRWPPERIATDPNLALRRLYRLPGSTYTDPQFSWKYAIAVSGIAFVGSEALGPDHKGELWVTEGRTNLLNGYLMAFKLTADRKSLAFSDPKLNDRVADNTAKFDVSESESLVIGQDFGIVAGIEMAPDGTMYLASLDKGALFQVRRKQSGKIEGGKANVAQD